jgi:hypothetical protein
MSERSANSERYRRGVQDFRDSKLRMKFEREREVEVKQYEQFTKDQRDQLTPN